VGGGGGGGGNRGTLGGGKGVWGGGGDPIFAATTVYMEMHLHRSLKYSTCFVVKDV